MAGEISCKTLKSLLFWFRKFSLTTIDNRIESGRQCKMWRNSGLLSILRVDLTQKRCLRVLFYGSDHFSLATLKVLAQEWWESFIFFWDFRKVILILCCRKRSNDSGLTELAVVTGIKRPPNPVHVYSQEQSIPFHSWPTGNDAGAFDIGVVVSFSHLIPQRIITSFPL